MNTLKPISLIALLSISSISPADVITRCSFSTHVKEGHGSRIREQNPEGCAILTGDTSTFYSKTKPMECPPGYLQYGPIQGGVIDTYIIDKKESYSIGGYELFTTGNNEAIVTHESRRMCLSITNIPKQELDKVREGMKPVKSKAEVLLEKE